MKLPMTRLQIIGLKRDLMPTLRTLHHLGCVQIDDVSAQENLAVRPWQSDETTIRQREELTHLVAELEGLLATFAQADTDSYPVWQDSCLDEARADITAVTPQVQQTVSHREALQAEQTSLPRYEGTLRKLLPIVPATANEPGHSFVCILIGRSHRWLLATVADKVATPFASLSRLFARSFGRAGGARPVRRNGTNFCPDGLDTRTGSSPNPKQIK